MRRMGLAVLAPSLAGLAAALASVAPARAHPLAPSLLELREQADGVVAVRFRTPLAQSAGADLWPQLPPGCRARGEAALATDATGATLRWLADCGPGGLRGAAIRIHGLRKSGTDALLRAELADGVLVRAVLRPGADTFTIPRHASRSSVAADYLGMGFGHLLSGVDHLLFVLGLVLLVPGRRRLLAAVTGFTLGHSATLSLAALGLVRAPPGLVEVGIAASLFWLATRLAHGEPAGGPFPHPWRMPALFGLLHGLGFAGALTQAGLPSGEIPLALLSFNFGIELGQLAVVAGLLVLRAGLRPLGARTPAWLARAPVYAIGTTAAALVFERVAAIVS